MYAPIYKPMYEQELTFGRQIRQQRRELELTQEELAERAGCSVDTIRKLEAGSLRPSRQLAEILAAKLEIPPDKQSALVALARHGPLREASARPAAHAPAVARAVPVASLPVQPTSFIGRQHEIATCLAILRRADARLLTLVGPGGGGKTRLALRITEEMMGAFRDGVFFVQLAPVSSSELVVPAITEALGLAQTTGKPLLDALKDFLREKHILVTLDNFEHVAPAAPLLMELLIAAPELRLLVTSREVLRLSGEHVFLVPPLNLPDLEALPGPEMLPAYEAIALFLQRAAAARADFVLTAENAEAIAEICAGLDGLPLAIELAAARVRLFSPTAMLARLHGRLAWLTGGPRDQTNRQQTLRATLDWSYKLLDPTQQAVFARLAVFAGGCTLEAAAAVAGADLDSIASLVDKSLLQEAAGRDGEARIHMLETVREYALERLVERGEDTTIRTLHASYFAELAAQAEAMLRSPGRGPWITRLDAEQENIRASLVWCLEGQGDRETGMRLAGSLVWYWRRTYPTEGRRWLQKAAAATGPGSTPELLGWCQAGAAFLTWPSEREVVRAGLREAIGILRRSPDRLKLAHALSWLGDVESDLGQHLPARAALDEALTAFTELGLEWDRAMGLHYSGLAEMQTWDTGGSREIALRHLEESYRIFFTLGDDWARALTINRLAWAMAQNGNYPSALSLLNEGLRLARQERSTHATATALRSLGMIMQVFGADYEGAAPFLREALEIWRELGDRLAEADTMHLLGFCMMAMGEIEQARTLCEEGLARCRQLGDFVATGWAMRDLACVYRLAGESARALELYESALITFKGGDSRSFHLICLIDLVALLGPSREPQTSATLLGAADALTESMMHLWSLGDNRSFDNRLKAESIEAARAALDAESFERAWRAGREMSHEQALDLAMAAVRRRLAAEGRSGD